MIKFGMPEVDYRAFRAFGSTDLKNCLRSYHHMEASRLEDFDTPALRLGRAAHCLLLEPDRFKREYVTMPTFMGKGMRDRKEKWIAETKGLTSISEEDCNTVSAMAGAVWAHNAAMNLLLDAKDREVSCIWTETVEDVPFACKARFDAMCEHAIIDLKTATDASPEGFGRQVANYNYLLQAAHYLTGLARSGLPPRDFIFIAVEKTPPYGVGVYKISLDQYGLGMSMRDQAFAVILGQTRAPKSTPYSHMVETLTMPRWAFKEQE